MSYIQRRTTRTLAGESSHWLLFFAVLLCAQFFSGAGWASPFNLSTGTGGGAMIQTALCGLKAMVSGTAAIALATIAVIIVGIGALTGKVQWSTAAIVAVGIAILLGVGSLISLFSPQGDVCAQNNFTPLTPPGGLSQIQTVLCSVIGFISGTPGVALCMLGILGLGAMAMLGKLSWGTALTVGAGMAVILGLSSVANLIGIGNGCSVAPQNWITTMPSACNGAMANSLAGFGFIEPLVDCFTGISGDDPKGGIFPSVAIAFLSVAKYYYFPLVQALATLAVAFFGIKLLAGEVENIRETTFTLLFKIGGVFYFMSNAPALFYDCIGILYWLCDTIAAAAGEGSTDQLWGKWDYVLGQIFGFAFTPNMAGIGAFLFLIGASKGIGLLIVSVGLYFLSGLFFSLVRFIHMFLMTILGFSFVFCLSYIFVPMLLFKGSFEKFQSWLNLVISLIVTPVIIIGYMALCMLAVNVVLFTGPLGIMTVVGAGCASGIGASSGGSIDGLGGDVFAQATSVGCRVSNFKSLFYIDHANSTVSSGNSSGSSGAAIDSSGNGFGANGQTCSQLQSSGQAAASPGAPSGSSGTVNGGVFGKNMRMEGPGSVYSSGALSAHPGAAIFGVEVGALQQACADLNGYNINVLLAFAAAALLMYVMYSLLDYIPAMAGELTAQGLDSFTSALGQQGKGSMPGAQAMKALGGGGG